MAFKPGFICPYCFERHRAADAQYRCGNARCADHDDIPMTRYENGSLDMPKKGKLVFSAARGGKAATCPDCGSKTYNVVCPSCHNLLPESSLSGKDMIISVVGSRDSGKSHFVGVIINELMERVAPRLFPGGALEGFADSYARYKAGFYRTLYEDLHKLELTRSSLQDVNNGAYRPLIFSLKYQSTNPLKKLRGENESVTFVFFDTAGEDLNDADVMSTVNKYICKSAGIIFLIDPLQVPAVAAQLDAAMLQRSASVDWRQATRPDDIMTRVSRLIRNDRGMRETQKIDIPVAAVFSKFDAIEPIVPPGATLLQPSPHCPARAYSAADVHNVNTEVQGLLQAWGAQAFMSQLGANYNHYAYFAVSALGLHNSPRPDFAIDRPRPHRIEDPLIWLLHENGVLKD